jgi:hypothetical protein
VKAPEAEAVIVAGTVVTVAPSNFIVTVEEGAKPAPVTVTVVPTGPCIGLSVCMRVTPVLSMQLAGLNLPSPVTSVKVTFPVDVIKKDCDGVPSVSVTLAVHFVEPPTNSDGTQPTAVEVLRR